VTSHSEWAVDLRLLARERSFGLLASSVAAQVVLAISIWFVDMSRTVLSVSRTAVCV
jgi:hypothetical protein